MDTNQVTSSKAFRIVGLILLIVATLFLLVKTINAFNGEGVAPTEAKPQITVTGQGEFSAKPDIALISYSVIEEGKTPSEAQDKATKRWNDTLTFLKNTGKIEDRDVKTIGYNLNPKYDYSNTNRACPTGFCAPGTPVLVGYTITQTAEVKIRDLAKAGDILSGIGSLGVQNVNGLTFTFDDPDKILAEARKQAIADAKEKAQVLANDLGVRLIRISRFEEAGNGPVYPKLQMDMALEARNGAGSAAPAPMLPTGENKLISNVTITYEIR
jgi:uncharacterized protein